MTLVQYLILSTDRQVPT